tara:strand:+ start:971 stop:1615 length:645 start_codon:yes stop_codon:yes gene_type:complete
MKMSTSKRGTFISFEGIDGCGKSTQVKILMDRLQEEGNECILVREPGGTKISEHIRDILLSNKNLDLSSRTEALLMTASRAQLTKQKIIPALTSGKCVIADRFSDSTLAYQGGGRGLDLDFLISLNDFATEGIIPDITFNLDINPVSAFNRSSSTEPDRIENAGIELQKKVRECYKEISSRFSNRIFTIDGSNSISSIHSTIWEITINCINEKN